MLFFSFTLINSNKKNIQELELEYVVRLDYRPKQFVMVLNHEYHMVVDQHRFHFLYLVGIDLEGHIDWFEHREHNLVDIVHIDHLHYFLDNPKQNRTNQFVLSISLITHTEHLPVSRSHRSDRSLHNDRHDQH